MNGGNKYIKKTISHLILSEIWLHYLMLTYFLSTGTTLRIRIGQN